MGQNFDFVLTLSGESLDSVFVLSKLLPEFVVLPTHAFEFVLEFADLACGKSEVLLGGPYLLTKTAVLPEQFLDSLFVAFRFLSRSAESIFVVIEFSTEPLCLGSRQSKVFLVLLHLSAERPNFSVLFLND